MKESIPTLQEKKPKSETFFTIENIQSRIRGLTETEAKNEIMMALVYEEISQVWYTNLETAGFTADQAAEVIHVIANEYKEEEQRKIFTLPHELQTLRFSDYHKRHISPQELVADLYRLSEEQGRDLGFHTTHQQIRPTEYIDPRNPKASTRLRWDVNESQDDAGEAAAYYSKDFMSHYDGGSYLYVVAVNKNDVPYSSDSKWFKTHGNSIVLEMNTDEAEQYIQSQYIALTQESARAA